MDVAEYRANSRLYIRRNKDDAVVVVVGVFVVVIHSRSIVWTMSSPSSGDDFFFECFGYKCRRGWAAASNSERGTGGGFERGTTIEERLERRDIIL
jgi:hypothetical protein